MRTKSDFALGAAALACLALMLVRTVSIFHQGPYVLTSGYEEESLFAIWKWINKQAVYGNAFAPPFAQSYFNWLFYFVYGAFSSGLLSIAKLDSLAVPVITRCLTFALASVSVLVVYQLLSPLTFNRRLAGSAIIAFNPLVGFWAVTTRPDVGALAFGLVGVWCIGKSARQHSSAWIGMAFLAFYCSWAFKQIYVAAFAATIFHFSSSTKVAAGIVVWGGDRAGNWFDICIGHA